MSAHISTSLLVTAYAGSMLRDARDIADSEELNTDLCIIGAGVAGLTLARSLMGSGHRVLVLESGGRGTEPVAQDPVHGSSVGYSYYNHDMARARGFGGSSLLWPLQEGWRARPLDPVDYESRPGIPNSGWPFGPEELAPYWSMANEVCGLGPSQWSVEDWSDPQTPPLAFLGDRVGTTMFQLGSSNFDRHWDAMSAAGDVTVLLHATVTNLEQGDASSAVESIEVANGIGGRFRVRSRCTVLAAGGLDNARLLLASRDRSPRGLGNGHDVVGRYFMERLSTRSGYLVPNDPELVPRALLYSVHHVRGSRVEGTLRVSDAVIREEHLLNCTFFMLARTRAFTAEAVRSLGTMIKGLRRQPRPEGIARHLRNVVTGPRDFLELVGEQHRRGNDWKDHVLVMRPQAEQLPNPTSRVTLGNRKDAFGTPRVKLDWRLTDFDRWSIRRHQEIVDEELRRAGLGRLERLLGDEDPPALFEGNKHHMGTTRMHPDPHRGVVDADARLHEAPNVFVAGSSIFPTAGCSNPTLTIAALSLRLADQLRRELSHPASIGTLEADG